MPQLQAILETIKWAVINRWAITLDRPQPLRRLRGCGGLGTCMAIHNFVKQWVEDQLHF